MATATRKCPKGNNVTDQSEDPTPMTPIDPSCSDCTTVVIGQNPELTLQKEGTFTDENSDGPAQVGETFTYTITQAAIDAGDVDNMATATRKCPKGNNVTDQSEDPTPMTPIDPSCSDCTTVVTGQNPELTLQKEGIFTDENSDEFAQIGETITYTFMSLLIFPFFMFNFINCVNFMKISVFYVKIFLLSSW